LKLEYSRVINNKREKQEVIKEKKNKTKQNKTQQNTKHKTTL